jgi:hypothetical protein
VGMCAADREIISAELFLALSQAL